MLWAWCAFRVEGHGAFCAFWLYGPCTPNVTLTPMSHIRIFGGWFCLLIWGGVHALQLEHVVHHHLADAVHTHECGHSHSPSETEKAALPFPAEWPVLQAPDGCPVCDWTCVPAMPVLAFHWTAVPTDWVRHPTLGEVCPGWADPVVRGGMGWRGPPGALAA